MLKKIYFMILFLAAVHYSTAQVWQYVGMQGFTPAVTQFSLTSFAIDHNGVLYVAYSDASDSDKISVMKFDGASWILVGGQAISAEQGYDISITVDANNFPYVAYGDAGNSSLATVKKFDGSNWLDVGTPDFSEGVVNNCTIRFSADDTAYVAYVDAFYSGRAVVKKFDGINWINVGTPGFTAGGTGQMTMALNASNLPYVAYQDQANGFAESVMMFDGSNWVHVGAATFSNGTCQFSHITFDNTRTIPYVCYNQGYHPFAPNVQLFDGGSWLYVGGQNLNTNVDYQNNIALDGNNMPYVIFPDGAFNWRASVMKYDGASWVYAGNTGFSSSGQIWYPNILTDTLNNVYVEYYDETDSNKISVLKLEIENYITDRKEDKMLCMFPNPANDKISFYIPDESGNYELHIKNTIGQIVYTQLSEANKIVVDISSLVAGVYFYEIRMGSSSPALKNTKGKFLKIAR
jgi:hypothetical protein